MDSTTGEPLILDIGAHGQSPDSREAFPAVGSSIGRCCTCRVSYPVSTVNPSREVSWAGGITVDEGRAAAERVAARKFLATMRLPLGGLNGEGSSSCSAS